MHLTRRPFFRICTEEASSSRLTGGALRLNLHCLPAADEADFLGPLAKLAA